MRNLLNEKTKQVLSVVFLILSVVFIVFLFAFKEKRNDFASKSIKPQAGSDIQNSESAFIDSTYNYTKNGLKYEVTFLEFGAKGCSACKGMESVMSEICTNYPNRINVVFVNIMLPENQRLMKYYGIAAIPTQVLLNKESKEVFRHIGYYAAEELIKNLTFN